MEALLEEGCIIVATSNRAPWDLNRHGLHEDLFGHFVQNLLDACQPYQLSAEQDYRRLLVNHISSSNLVAYTVRVWHACTSAHCILAFSLACLCYMQHATFQVPDYCLGSHV